jgi:hypothetical protein
MKKTNLINLTIIRALLPTVILLAACTADADYNDYADNAARSNASLKIYATIDNSGWGASTRADKNATSFANGDKIGVTISDKYSNKEYTYNDGTFTTTDGVYYENMYEKATAYYPYNENGGTISGEAQNFLYATSTEGSIFKDYNTSSAPSINLTFKHAMARLKIKFRGDGNDADDDQFVDLAVNGIKTTGTFNTQTGEAIATGDAGTIKGTDGVSLDTIVFPQVPSDKKIKVTFNLRGNIYTTTISCDTLEAGKSYEYTVKYSRPTWFTNVAFARVGDYAFTDDESKNFLASYAYESASDEQKAKCTGVVFWTSKEDKNKLTMSQNEIYSTFTRGLIAKVEKKDNIVWQEKRYTSEKGTDTYKYKDIDEDGNEKECEGKNEYDNYGIVSLASFIKTNNLSPINTDSIQGYHLSNVIKNYNETFGYGDAYQTNDYQTANYIDVYLQISEANSKNANETRYEQLWHKMIDAKLYGKSVWYLPSIKELELLFDAYNNNPLIKNALGTLDGVYWSSTEGDACTDGHETRGYSVTVINESKSNTTTFTDTIKEPTYSSKVYVYDNQTNVEKGKKQEDKFAEHTVIQVCAF